MVGQPLGIYWGAQTHGVYANWDEAIRSGIAGAAPGEIKYVNNHIDYDSSGQPLSIQEINFDDYVKIGDPNPDFSLTQYQKILVIKTGMPHSVYWSKRWRFILG